MPSLLINVVLTVYGWVLGTVNCLVSLLFCMTLNTVSWWNYLRRIFRDKVVECLSTLVNLGWTITLCKNPAFLYNSNYMGGASRHTMLLAAGSVLALVVQLSSIILTRKDDQDENAGEPDDSPKRKANTPWIWALRTFGFSASAVISTYATVIINISLLNGPAKAPSPYLPLMIAVIVGSWGHLIAITWSYAQSRRKSRDAAPLPPGTVPA